jgi:hypothetical protein
MSLVIFSNTVLKLKLICDRQSVGQFVWVSGLPMGPLTRFYLILFSADNYLIGCTVRYL